MSRLKNIFQGPKAFRVIVYCSFKMFWRSANIRRKMTKFHGRRLMLGAFVSFAFLLLMWWKMDYNYTLIPLKLTDPHVLFQKTTCVEEVIQHKLAESEVIWTRSLEKREKAVNETKLPLDNHYGLLGLRILWDFFYPEFNCPHNLERVGQVGDGGKWVCGINQLIRKGNACVVYSYGLSHEVSFESEILQRTNCSLHGYDHTINPANNPLPKNYPNRATVSKIGLGVENTANLRTLKSEMISRGHAFIDILKIDIEGQEQATLPQIIKDFPNGLPFGQLIIEIHLHLFLTSNLFEDLKSWWDGLERAGLRAYHSEPNLYGQARPNQLSPLCYEYSFLNVKTDHIVLHG